MGKSGWEQLGSWSGVLSRRPPYRTKPRSYGYSPVTPLRAHIVVAAQAEAPKISSLLDLTEDRLDDCLAHHVPGRLLDGQAAGRELRTVVNALLYCSRQQFRAGDCHR